MIFFNPSTLLILMQNYCFPYTCVLLVYIKQLTLFRHFRCKVLKQSILIIILFQDSFLDENDHKICKYRSCLSNQVLG